MHNLWRTPNSIHLEKLSAKTNDLGYIKVFKDGIGIPYQL